MDAAQDNTGTTAQAGIFDRDLVHRPANFTPLSPLSFLLRSALGFADQTAIIDGARRFTYAQFAMRCRRLASALQALGIGRGHTVAILAPNVPAMLEAHFAVPMLGAVLNALNVRLDPASIAFILAHGEAKVLLVDRELGALGRAALDLMPRPPKIIGIDDSRLQDGLLLGDIEYEAVLASGDATFVPPGPKDEWDAIALNYTSGTTGDPKGVVIHHRGAFLNALSNLPLLGLTRECVYLWTLPMFHCNGWCHTWSVTALAGTHVCLRRIDPAEVFALIDRHRVTHMSGAPVVLNMLLHSAARRDSTHEVVVTTGGAAPAASVLERTRQLHFHVIHAYGLTETYGPSLACDWKGAWNALPAADQAERMSRQGLSAYGIAETIVADPVTLQPVPADGRTIGEIMQRGATIMKGYLKNPTATEAAFAGGWFHTGDLAVLHPDGYVEVKDRSKDIIISGGENISSLEVESVLYRHPAIAEAAVVARPDAKWGETPCAFIALRDNATATPAELSAFCRERMAHYKVPGAFIFGPLPKTATGKIQKHILRERARTAPE